MNKAFILLLAFILSLNEGKTQDFSIGETHTYQQLIEAYQKLDLIYEDARLFEIGKSDNGLPIHLFIINKKPYETLEDLNSSSEVRILINNGIHPGEACGIEASILLAKNYLQNNSIKDKNVIIGIIPTYNIGGMLNRNSFSRANQNGPNEYGFRGNAKNLDLNRDFIKMDSKNAFTFVKVFHSFNPDIFIDTHTTNGSDHQYTLTLISSQKDKMNPVLSAFNDSIFLPKLYKAMELKGKSISPYVYPLKKEPQEGLHAFLETPRYSSGFTNLFNCLSFITEAHVFKPFKDRVLQTQAFLESIIELSDDQSAAIKLVRRKADEYDLNRSLFPLKWVLDTTIADTLDFKGFNTSYVKSKVTDLQILKYHHNQPYEKPIIYLNSYNVSDSIKQPSYYIIPQAYHEIVERLNLNKVKLIQLSKDSLVSVTAYKIKNYKTVNSPYEGHYLHYDITTEKQNISKQFFKGDYLITTDQKNVRFLTEVLEPRAHDSYFAWNFFDNILQQKEWFSDYAFEPIADSILKSNPTLKADFEAKKINDKDFAKNSFQQLYYIYKHSLYYESTVNLYPIYRIE